jgi:hypothetical protein
VFTQICAQDVTIVGLASKKVKTQEVIKVSTEWTIVGEKPHSMSDTFSVGFMADYTPKGVLAPPT